MNDKAKAVSPPYATYGAFLNFINKLRETGVPSRIDPTVFGNASGSLSYSIIAALKFLKLTDDSGTPSQAFITLVKATDDERPTILKEVVQAGYPSLFRPDVNLGAMSAGQFDEHVRNEFDVKGSTVDKIALFFIGAAKAAGITLSPHLLARRPVASSSSAQKSAKQRKKENGDLRQDANGGGSPDAQVVAKPAIAKELEYQLIDLMTEPDIDDPVKQSIWALVQYLTARKAKQALAAKPASA